MARRKTSNFCHTNNLYISVNSRMTHVLYIQVQSPSHLALHKGITHKNKDSNNPLAVGKCTSSNAFRPLTTILGRNLVMVIGKGSSSFSASRDSSTVIKYGAKSPKDA